MNKDKIFDELLILKCQEGDQKAFRLLLNRWNKKLIFFAYKFTNDMEAARDVVQESWISIHKGLNRLNDHTKFSTWAFRITYNKSMDHLRQKQRVNQIETLPEDSTDDTLENYNEDVATVNGLLAKMPAQHKIILTLFYQEQQSIKQIAEVLKLPEGTVKSRIYYARELLKRKYKEAKNETY